MAKEFYDISYKTYYNARLKPVLFRGMETHPLYVQVTFNRKTIFFKSSYFEIFAQPKYESLGPTLLQVEELEIETIEYVIDQMTGSESSKFNLDWLLRVYRQLSIDLLDSFDGPFKARLAAFLKEENLIGLAYLIEAAPDGVPGIILWENLRKCLEPGIMKRLEKKMMQASEPYLPLAIFIQQKFPKGPFCLPMYIWLQKDKSKDIEDHWQAAHTPTPGPNMPAIIRTVSKTLLPNGLPHLSP